MAKQIVSNIIDKSDRQTIVGIREEFKGKDLVNLREFVVEGDDMTATKSGFTIPADQFQRFFKELRKFGRAAGLLPEQGEDPKAFEMKPLSALVGEDEEGEEEDEGEEEGGEKEEATGIKRNKKDKKAKKADKKAAKEKAAKVKKNKDGKKAKKSDDEEFSMKDFKKAIKAAFKHADDMSYAAEVMTMYKEHRKQLREELPKHAVNACEKSLANKKDDGLLAKAVVSLIKHVVGE